MARVEEAPAVADLSAVDEAVESLLSSLDGFTLLDRIEMEDSQALPKTKLGTKGALYYTLGRSRNERDSSRQRRWSTAETDLTVMLWVRINPHQQRAGRRSALEQEAVIRSMLTATTWNGGVGFTVLYEATPQRQIASDVYRAEITFVVRHTIRVGGGA